MAKSNSFFNIDMLVLSLLKVKDCYGYELVKLIKEISNSSLDIKEVLFILLYIIKKKKNIFQVEMKSLIKKSEFIIILSQLEKNI